MHELERPLSEVEISCICCQMCTALEFIHSRNVIHRDMKAGNILVDAEGRAKLGISCSSNNLYIKYLPCALTQPFTWVSQVLLTGFIAGIFTFP